jgi:hypothetical protein
MTVHVKAPPRWAARRVVALASDRPELTIRDLALQTGLRPTLVRVCLANAGVER